MIKIKKSLQKHKYPSCCVRYNHSATCFAAEDIRQLIADVNL